MEYENILTESMDNVQVITINRPNKLNALNRETIGELHQAIETADKDSNVRCIIIRGAGTKAFVAGADIAEFANYSVQEGTELSTKGHQVLFDYIENLSKPVIAAVNGFALGGGLELAMSCHLRVASDNARMGLPEVSLGVIPGYGGTQRLPQLVGKGKAFEMIASAAMIKADEAERYGLVNYVTTQEELMDKCLELAAKITNNSPTAITNAIAAINAGFHTGVNGYEEEIRLFGVSFGTEDFKEGTTAFLEKRKADFPGN